MIFSGKTQGEIDRENTASMNTSLGIIDVSDIPGGGSSPAGLGMGNKKTDDVIRAYWEILRRTPSVDEINQLLQAAGDIPAIQIRNGLFQSQEFLSGMPENRKKINLETGKTEGEDTTGGDGGGGGGGGIEPGTTDKDDYTLPKEAQDTINQYPDAVSNKDYLDTYKYYRGMNYSDAEAKSLAVKDIQAQGQKWYSTNIAGVEADIADYLSGLKDQTKTGEASQFFKDKVKYYQGMGLGLKDAYNRAFGLTKNTYKDVVTDDTKPQVGITDQELLNQLGGELGGIVTDYATQQQNLLKSFEPLLQGAQQQTGLEQQYFINQYIPELQKQLGEQIQGMNVGLESRGMLQSGYAGQQENQLREAMLRQLGGYGTQLAMQEAQRQANLQQSLQQQQMALGQGQLSRAQQIEDLYRSRGQELQDVESQRNYQTGLTQQAQAYQAQQQRQQQDFQKQLAQLQRQYNLQDYGMQSALANQYGQQIQNANQPDWLSTLLGAGSAVLPWLGVLNPSTYLKK